MRGIFQQPFSVDFLGESLRKIEKIEFSQVAKPVVVPNSGSNPDSASAPPPLRQLLFSFRKSAALRSPCCPLAGLACCCNTLLPHAGIFCCASAFLASGHLFYKLPFEIATAMVLMER
jgi:hypothetical protein